MSDDRCDLSGKAALVTGATRGIGLAIARAFLERGAAVLITARRPEELEAAKASLEGSGRVEAFTASAGDRDAIEASARACVDRLGAIDVLVNNAATNPQFGPLLDADLGAVEKVWSVNLLGPLLYCRAAWHLSMRERGGSIINVASVAGMAPTAMSGAYNVAKAGLIHLSRQLALELGPGVRVNTLVPGLVRTRFGEAQYAKDEAAVVARHPLGRLGEPDDLAGAALLLASAASSWMTGQTVVVEGGALQAWWPVDREEPDDPAR
jgi:NAD(P)-dependent dehydrogenase (short-subunit alcohol dehydrogenase family)